MANITIENVDSYSIEREGGKFRDDVLQFTGADTYVKGTILARKAVATTITAAADVGNTGDGTCTAAAVVASPTVPLVGAYNLECTAAVTNGGTFKLEDPNGALVANELVMTAGAGASTVFEVGGMTFTVTDGATDFVVGDKFSLTVAADGDLVAFVVGGLGGAQTPVAVLTYDITVTGASDVACRVLVAGEVNRTRLVIDADGDASNVTETVCDQLRDVGIVPINVQQLAALDNQ